MNPTDIIAVAYSIGWLICFWLLAITIIGESKGESLSLLIVVIAAAAVFSLGWPLLTIVKIFTHSLSDTKGTP